MISRLVPPKNDARPVVTPNFIKNVGSIAIIAKNIAPGNVIFVNILSM